MSWLTKPKEKNETANNANVNPYVENFQKFIDAQNSKTHFNFNRIMDDSSIGSLLNPGNKATKTRKPAVAMAPGVNLGKQTNNKEATVDNDSISDISSKGSTAKTIYNRIDANENKLNAIGNLLERLMVKLDNPHAGNDQDETRNLTTGDQNETPSLEKGPSL